MRGRRARARCLDPFFSRSGGDAGRTNIGAINEPEIPVDFSLFIQTDLQGFEDSIEGAVAAVAVEATIDGLPFAVAFGHVAPWCTRPKNPEHPIDDLTMVLPLSTATLLGKQLFDQIPLRIFELVSGHVSSVTNTACQLLWTGAT